MVVVPSEVVVDWWSWYGGCLPNQTFKIVDMSSSMRISIESLPEHDSSPHGEDSRTTSTPGVETLSENVLLPPSVFSDPQCTVSAIQVPEHIPSERPMKRFWPWTRRPVKLPEWWKDVVPTRNRVIWYSLIRYSLLYYSCKARINWCSSIRYSLFNIHVNI